MPLSSRIFFKNWAVWSSLPGGLVVLRRRYAASTEAVSAPRESQLTGAWAVSGAEASRASATAAARFMTDPGRGWGIGSGLRAIVSRLFLQCFLLPDAPVADTIAPHSPPAGHDASHTRAAPRAV